MKERPILFSGEMVKAILEGRKTQTRRVIWPKSLMIPYRNSMEKIQLRTTKDHYLFDFHYEDGTISTIYGIRPKYHIGGLLWVRETVGIQVKPNNEYPNGYVIYKADNPDGDFQYEGGGSAWTPSIYMPRWATRILLEVTNVRVERVQDISEEDATAEGVSFLFSQEDCDTVAGIRGTKPEEHGYENYLWHGNFRNQHPPVDWEYQFSNYKNARDSYSSLWHLLNAKRGYGWDVNPWVWVIEFKRVD